MCNGSKLYLFAKFSKKALRSINDHITIKYRVRDGREKRKRRGKRRGERIYFLVSSDSLEGQFQEIFPTKPFPHYHHDTTSLFELPIYYY